MNVYVYKNETQFGPYSIEQIKQYIQEGNLTLEDYACYDGQNWVKIEQLQSSFFQSIEKQPDEDKNINIYTNSPKRLISKKLIFLGSAVICIVTSTVIFYHTFFKDSDQITKDNIAAGDTKPFDSKSVSSSKSSEKHLISKSNMYDVQSKFPRLNYQIIPPMIEPIIPPIIDNIK